MYNCVPGYGGVCVPVGSPYDTNAAGSPVQRDQKYDLKLAGKNVEKAADSGNLYSVVSFPQYDYLEAMKQFAKQTMQSYTGLD